MRTCAGGGLREPKGREGSGGRATRARSRGGDMEEGSLPCEVRSCLRRGSLDLGSAWPRGWEGCQSLIYRPADSHGGKVGGPFRGRTGGWVLRSGEMGAGLGHRSRWPSHGSRNGQGTWQGPGRRWDESGMDGVLGGNSWTDRRGRGLGSRRRRVVSQGLWGARAARVRLTGIVQEKHQRDPPGQHRVPGPHQDARAEQRPGRHSLGPWPHPEEAPRGAGPPRGRGPRCPAIGQSWKWAGPWWGREAAYWMEAAA